MTRLSFVLPEFPTSRLEMETVSDIFDRNHDGFIDYQEFIAALRPDWERKGPITDDERIDVEVQKQVNLCTCRQKFKVHQVGEGKYRVSCPFVWVHSAMFFNRFSPYYDTCCTVILSRINNLKTF